jgi:hypothetical protein
MICAGYCATSEQRRAEAHAFLVAEAHNLDREGKARPAGIERVHAFDGGDHAEHAVVLSGIANGIEMRTQHQARLSGSRALVAAGTVADGVDARVHAGLAHPAQHEFAGLPLLGGKEYAGQSAREFRQAAERIAAIPDALRLQ